MIKAQRKEPLEVLTRPRASSTPSRSLSPMEDIHHRRYLQRLRIHQIQTQSPLAIGHAPTPPNTPLTASSFDDRNHETPSPSGSEDTLIIPRSRALSLASGSSSEVSPLPSPNSRESPYKSSHLRRSPKSDGGPTCFADQDRLMSALEMIMESNKTETSVDEGEGKKV